MILYCFEVFLIFPNFLKMLSFKSFGNSWSNSYIPCLLLINMHRFTCGERKIWSNIKSVKYYNNVNLSLLRAPIVKNSHILARISFVFLKSILDKIWKAFNNKFGLQWKDRKSNYQVREILSIFCKLFALSLA